MDHLMCCQKKWILAASEPAANADCNGIAAEIGKTQTLTNNVTYTPPVAKAALIKDATKLPSVTAMTVVSIMFTNFSG